MDNEIIQKNNEIEESNDLLVKLENVTLMYNLTLEKINSFKDFFIKLFKGELRFQKFLVLKNINFEIRRGDSIGVIGTNGCGKSTLLKLIAGILMPTEGKITTNGTIAPLINLGAGFDLEANAIENIYFNGALLGFSRAEMKQKISRIIKFAELQKFVNVPLKNYSSGMVSRLGFAIAVDVNPDVLLVDEILSVGDENFKIKCLRKINELKKKGTSIIFVSHSMYDVQQICNKAIWIKDNAIFEQGDSSEVCSKYLSWCEQMRSEENPT